MAQRMTSLAQQLGQLKLNQRDEVHVPERARLSFLFDIKQAANIDDQTLFYIMQGGVHALAPVLDLEAFTSDLLCEKSLTFYRATETAETLKPIDARVGTLLKLLAPHFLDTGCHKVLEYLIRVYDVHVYQKALLLNAFLPFFETSYFLRVIQLLSLENDQEYGFLHPFAYQGKAIDKASLIKFMGRTSGLVFTKYADFCMGLLEIPGHDQAKTHWKFFGSMLSEVLRAHSSDQNLMFSCLPFIQKSLKQTEVRDLQIAGLLALSQLACRKSLSAEYTQAFVRQVLKTIAGSPVDEDLQQKGLVVLLFLALYQGQSLSVLKTKDFKLALSIAENPRLFQGLSSKYDASSLAKVFLRTALRDPRVEIDTLHPLFRSLTTQSLKTTFILVQTAVFEAVEHTVAEVRERCFSVLRLLKELGPTEFSQSSMYLLKRLSSDVPLKQKVLEVLSGKTSSATVASSKLISTFGDKEYSILNALSAAHNETRMAALQALQDRKFLAGLTPAELAIVKLVLLQSLSDRVHTDEATALILQAVVNILKTTSEEASDAEFECIESLLDEMHTPRPAVHFAEELKERVAFILVNDLSVAKPQNQSRQVWIALSCYVTADKLTQSRNAFYSYLQAASLTSKSPSKSSLKSPGKISVDALVESFVAKPIQAIKFLLDTFTSEKLPAYVDFAKMATLLQKLGQKTKTNMMKSTFAQQLYLPLLKAVESKRVPHADKVLAAIVTAIPPFETSLQDNSQSFQCIETLLKVAVRQKHASKAEFNFAGLFQTVFETTLAGNKALLADMLVMMAIESTCLLTRIFACLHLTQLHANLEAKASTSVVSMGLCINQETALALIVILLHDESSVLREHALAFAAAYSKALASGVSPLEIVCFSTNKKIVSTAKRSADNFKPLEKSASQGLLKTLFKVRVELIQDSNQLQTTLAKVKSQEVFEHLCRQLSDLPTMAAKGRLISVLALVPQQSLVFAMNLCKVQDKLFAELTEQAAKAGALDFEGLNLVIQLAHLVSTQHSQALKRQQAAPELMVSLVLPFVQYVTDKQESITREISSSVKHQECVSQLKQTIVGLFERNILQEVCLIGQDDQVIQDVFRLYLGLQSGLLRGSSERLKSLFIDTANAKVFTGAQLAMVLAKTCERSLSEAVSRNDAQGLDILLETIVQVQLSQSREMLNQEALNVISTLVDSFCGKKMPNLQASDFAFTIELASQLCLQTFKPNAKRGPIVDSGEVEQKLSTLVGRLLTHTKQLSQEILSREEVDTQDPFSEFMSAKRADKDVEMSSEEEPDGLEAELLPCYQIILSVLTLLTKGEASKQVSLTQTALRLQELAELVLLMSNLPTRQVLKRKELTSALFHLYHAAVMKTAITAKTLLSDYPMKDCLLNFTELVVTLFDGAYEELVSDGAVYLRVLTSAGLESYGFLSSLFLIARAAKDQKLNISKTLEIDVSTSRSSGSALFLLKKVLLTSLETHHNLAILDTLIYSLSQIRFAEEVNEFLEDKTKLVFAGEGNNAVRNSINGLNSWIMTSVLASNERATRKFLYLGICVLEQWLSRSPEFQTKLARLAGTETPAPEIQTQLVNCFLSSYLIAQANLSMLNLERTSEDKQFKKSLLRLSRNSKKLQQALNEIFSLQIHVEIVLKILDLGQASNTLSKKERQALIPLKNNCLQLLNEKISSYNKGFLANASKPQQSVFRRLIEKAISLLREGSAAFSEERKAVNESHARDVTLLNESLLATLQFTCCAKTLSKQLQDSSIEIVQHYQALFLENGNRLRHLKLQTQLILTEYHIFEAYALAILEHLPAFFSQVVEGFTKAKEVFESKSEQIIFFDTYQAALLKASISIATLFLKFLNARQLEQLIVAVTTSRAASSAVLDESSHVSIILDTIGQEAKAHKKLVVHATFNAYSEIVTQSIGTAAFTKQSLRYFSELLCPVLNNLPAKFVQEHSKKFIIFLKECFGLSSRASKRGQDFTGPTAAAIVDCFNAFVVKLSEEQLRPVVSRVTRWAMKQKNEEEFDFHKALVYCQLLSGVLETLKEFFVPLIGIFFENGILKILVTLNKLLKGSPIGKRSRAQIDHSEVSQELSEAVLVQVCRTIMLLFKHDATCFIQNDSVEKLIDPIADLVSVLKVSDFMGFVERSVRPLMFEMVDRVNDDSMWVKVNYALLMKTRSEAWMTRKAALVIIEHLFEGLRERYLVVLNDTIPFLSELLEDEHEQVEQTARKIVERIEQMTGESINDYLK